MAALEDRGDSTARTGVRFSASGDSLHDSHRTPRLLRPGVAIALAARRFVLRMFPPVLRQRLSDVVLLVGKMALFGTADVSRVVGFRLDSLLLEIAPPPREANRS